MPATPTPPAQPAAADSSTATGPIQLVVEAGSCCTYTDGPNVINICTSGNTLYIGCPPPCSEAASALTDPAANTETD